MLFAKSSFYLRIFQFFIFDGWAQLGGFGWICPKNVLQTCLWTCPTSSKRCHFSRECAAEQWQLLTNEEKNKYISVFVFFFFPFPPPERMRSWTSTVLSSLIFLAITTRNKNRLGRFRIRWVRLKSKSN